MTTKKETPAPTETEKKVVKLTKAQKEDATRAEKIASLKPTLQQGAMALQGCVNAHGNRALGRNEEMDADPTLEYSGTHYFKKQ